MEICLVGSCCVIASNALHLLFFGLITLFITQAPDSHEGKLSLQYRFFGKVVRLPSS